MGMEVYRRKAWNKARETENRREPHVQGDPCLSWQKRSPAMFWERFADDDFGESRTLSIQERSMKLPAPSRDTHRHESDWLPD